jgi:proteasome accessory factor C
MPAPPLDRLERITDLVLVLLNTTHPLTLESIAYQVPGYPLEHLAKRQAFERDKRLLRDEGIPLITEKLPGEEQFGYLIDRAAFYLPDLALEPDEQVALQLAVAGVHLGDPSGSDALMKLGATGLGEVRPIANLVPPDALVDLFEAVRLGSETSFSYRGAARRVVPVGLWFRFGHWYLVAWDIEREDVRTFRVDRVQGSVTRLAPETGSEQLPEGLDIDIRAALPSDPWEAGDGEDNIVTRIRVDAMEGPRVAEEVGAERVESVAADGSVILRFEVNGLGPVRAWVLGLSHHAEILEPPEFRSEMRAWLGAIVDGDGDAPLASEAGSAGGVGAGENAGGGLEPSAPSRSKPGEKISQRLRRLLAVVGWLAQVGEAPIAEVARRFGMEEEELIYELELAACCGVPPYTPDVLMEIVVSEGSVRAFLPAEFARPRRLTPAEGFAVAASARLILAVPGSGSPALQRALDKLDSALGSHAALGVDVDAPQFLAAVRTATQGGEVLEIDYHSASRDEATTRVVEPMQVVTRDGHWYLDAYCRQAGDVRRFRVDRLRDVRVLEDAGPVTPHDVPMPSDGFLPGPGAVEVHLHLGKGAQWVAETIPVRSVVEGPDSLVTDVVLDVAGMAWFERLLLQLGTEASVVSPAEMKGLAASAAQQVLRMYEDDLK